MKQVLQTRNGSTVVRDVPDPPCPPGSVLVRNAYSVISSGTERSRVELSKQSLLGKARARPDLVRQVVDKARTEGIAATRRAVETKLSTETSVGYSSAGTVVAVGPRVAGLRPSDRVACGGEHAGHAEIVAVPRNLVARVPGGVSLADASFATIAAVALHGLRLAEIDLGARVAVVGCGLIGQIACRLAGAAGAEVIAVDVDPSRVADAVAAGADAGFAVAGDTAARVADATDGIGVDAVLVTAAAATNAPLLLAAEIARDRGAVVLVGAVPIELPREPFYDKELSFRVSRSYGPGRYDAEYEERGLDYPIGHVRWTEGRNMETVLSLLARGRLSLDGLVDSVMPVEDAVEAYERLVATDATRPRGAILLRYPEGSAPPPPRAAGPRASVSGAPRVALIGPGSFAQRILVPAFVAAGATLELAAGGTGPSADAATRAGFARSAASVDAALADPEVDVVVVATRHVDHARLATAALDAGKHVFVEKPLAVTRDELDGVLDAAVRSDGILSVGFNRRFAPLTGEVAAALATGAGPATAHFRVAAGHIEAEHWVHDLEQGGGRLIGEACHFVDTLRFLIGAPITTVVARGFAAPGAPIQAADNAAIVLEFADGSVGTILYAAEGGRGVGKERLEVFRQGVTAVLDDFRSAEVYVDGGRERRRGRGQDKGHHAEVRAFVEGLARGVAPIALDELENVSRASIAVVESLTTGSVVQLG
jgi:predicted dehydrogenase